ncbi:MAG: manganese transport protein [Paraglaciecola sp.]|jgi:manganese transport protein
MKNTFQNILFWSIISAAFIGPGTVTTASKAGASFGLALLWALLFSTLATVILQEAAARITIASGKNLGEIIAIKYQQKSGDGLKWGIFLAVAFGCAAYQAGNMLGAISGIELISDWSPKVMTLIIGIICAAILWVGNLKIIAKILGFIVAFMGIAFIYVAFQTDISAGDFLKNLAIPSMPEGSSLLVIGLIGTTIVPYNLFLASGISPGQEIKEMRQGIGLAVLIGGLISMAIMVAGTQVSGEFSFAALAETLDKNLGKGGAIFLGFGLFAAGLSSSITSPLAAAVTAKSLFGNQQNWSTNGLNFRLVWGIILLIGLAFGISGIKPVPAIILAQAINGALLPIVAIFLILVVNDEQVLPKKYLNSHFLNILMLLIVGITGFLGMTNFLKALSNLFNPLQTIQFELALGAAILLIAGLSWKIYRK